MPLKLEVSKKCVQNPDRLIVSKFQKMKLVPLKYSEWYIKILKFWDHVLDGFLLIFNSTRFRAIFANPWKRLGTAVLRGEPKFITKCFTCASFFINIQPMSILMWGSPPGHQMLEQNRPDPEPDRKTLPLSDQKKKLLRTNFIRSERRKLVGNWETDKIFYFLFFFFHFSKKN